MLHLFPVPLNFIAGNALKLAIFAKMVLAGTENRGNGVAMQGAPLFREVIHPELGVLGKKRAYRS